MSRRFLSRARRLPRPLRMAVITLILAPVLLPAALLSLGMIGLGALLDPLPDFELASPEGLWPEPPATEDPALPQELLQIAA